MIELDVDFSIMNLIFEVDKHLNVGGTVHHTCMYCTAGDFVMKSSDVVN